MNPRYRRLLIPGLLVLLLVVVVVASLVQDAQASAGPAGPQEVSVLDDPRITESSGLAVSARHDDLAYTVNDSGHRPRGFAVRVSTGGVGGVTRLRGQGLTDVEALALDADGRLWVADTGDNRGVRRDAALYVLDEPGPGDRSVRPDRYPVDYGDERPDVEAVVVRDGTVSLLEKGLAGGSRYEVDVADLVPGRRTAARRVATDVPPMVTDAAVAPDGRVVLRTYVSVLVLDADWRQTDQLEAPTARQAETIAVEPSGESVLVGSEGTSQPLWRVALPAAEAAVSGDPDAAPGSEPVSPGAAGFVVEGRDLVVPAVAAAGVVVGLGLVLVGLRRRRS